MGSLTFSVHSNTQLLKKKMKYCVILLTFVFASFTTEAAKGKKQVLAKLNKIEGRLEDLLQSRGIVAIDSLINQEVSVNIYNGNTNIGSGVIDPGNPNDKITISHYYYRITRITGSYRSDGEIGFCDEFNQDPGTLKRQFRICPKTDSSSVCYICDVDKPDCCSS